MNRQLSHQEIQDLLGAYALDAVDGDERVLVERHLAACPACQVEVDRHREAASWLVPSAEMAPPDVWEQIAGKLERPEHSSSPPAPVVPFSARQPRRVRILAATTLVAAAAAGLLGVRVVDQDRRLQRIEAAIAQDPLQRATRAAAADPAAVRVVLASTDQQVAGEIVLLPGGRGYLLADDLPALDTDRTYQLWALVAESEPISAAILGHRPRVAVFQVSGPVAGFAITDERAPGVVASENPPVVIGQITDAE